MQQAVGLVMTAGTGEIETAFGVAAASDIEITDFDVSDISLDEIESTHQGTYSSGTAAYRTYQASLLNTSGTIRLSMLYDGEAPVIGSPFTPLLLTFNRDVDVRLLTGNAYLKSYSLSGTLGDRITADVDIKFTGEVTFGPAS